MTQTETAKRGRVTSISSPGTEAYAPEPAFAEQHWRIKELAERWATSREMVRLLVKDEPGVIKISQGRKAARTTYSIPSSVAQKIHTRLCGEDSSFDQRHYHNSDLAALWSIGREKVRLLIKDEPGVMKFRNGRKKAHTAYSVPESVVRRIHLRLAA